MLAHEVAARHALKARRNTVLALALLAFALGVAASIFLWRFAHHTAPMPSGSGYGMAAPAGGGSAYAPAEGPANSLNNPPVTPGM